MKLEGRNTIREDDDTNMKVVESFLTKNPCYKTNRKIAVRGLALYSVGCPQPSAKVFINNWNNEKHSRACAHAFVDANDGLVYQTLPWNHRGWHGDADHNNTMISIMLCEPRQIKYRNAGTFDVVSNRDDAVIAAERVYQSAVELCGQLCVKYDFDPFTAIWAPDGGNADPEHLWQGLDMGYTMDQFRADVLAEMDRIRGVTDEVAVVTETATVGEPAPVSATADDEAVAVVETATVGEPVVPVVSEKPAYVLRVRVEYDNLRIRTGPGTNCETTGAYTGRGIFNIVEIQNGSGSKSGWGKLEDGSGWISLDFVEKA